MLPSICSKRNISEKRLLRKQQMLSMHYQYKKISDMDVYLFHVASVYRLISCLHKMQQSFYTTFPCHSTFNIFFICCSSFSVSATIYHKRERKSRSFSKKIWNFRRDSFFNYSDADIEVIITIRSRTIPISKYALRRAV